MGSHNELEIKGLDELRAALRKLPAELSEEAGAIVQAHAEEAARQIGSAYEQHVWTGRLRDSLTVRQESGAVRFGARWIVKNTAPHAWWAEHGTQIRKTAAGANRGAMPPIHAFIPVAMRQRRLMVEALKITVQKAGLLVSDTEL